MTYIIHKKYCKHFKIRDDVIPIDPIGDFENEQQDSSAALFQCRERTLHSKEPYPPRALLTVFSITQSNHSITLGSIHDNTDFEIQKYLEASAFFYE